MNVDIFDIEKVVIATLFSDFIEYYEESLLLSEDDFITKDYKLILNAMYSLHQKDMPIDEIFLKENIKDKSFNENTLIEILCTTPVVDIRHYIDLLKSNKNKRLLKNEISKILNNDSFTDVKIIANIEDITTNLQKGFISRFNPLKIIDLPNGELQFFLKSLLPIPKNAITIFSSKGGGAKTSTLVQLALRIALENTNTKILSWFSEDPLIVIKKRVTEATTVLNKNISIENIDFFGSETIPFHVFIDEKKYILSDEWHKFKSFILANKYKVIILDPLIAFYGGDENNNSQARFFMNILNEFSIKYDITFIIIHHHSKGDTVRGASAFIDAVRLHYAVELFENDDRFRNIVIKKDNWNVHGIIGKNKIALQIFNNKNKNNVSNNSKYNDRKIINFQE